MSTRDGPPSILLTYEPRLSRERLADGALRITVVTSPSRTLMILSAAAGAAVVLAVVAFLLGPQTVPIKFLVYGVAALPLCIGSLLATLMAPRRTHVLEVSAAGLRVQTTITGDPVNRFHPAGEILSVRHLGMGLEIRTTKDAYTGVAFADGRLLDEVAATINRELRGENRV